MYPPNKAPDRPTVPEARRILREWLTRPENACGGVFHIILEDGNIAQSDADWCLERAREEGDALDVRIGEMLAAMTSTQRGRLCALFPSY